MSQAPNSMTAPLLYHSIQHFSIPHGETWHQPLHRHPETAELLLVLEGTVHCKLGDHAHPVPSGTVLLVPPGCWHELWYGAAQQQRACCLSFAWQDFVEFSHLADLSGVIQVDDFTGVASLIVRLQQEKEHPQPDSKRMAHHLIWLILALVSRSAETAPARNDQDFEETVRQVQHYMEEHHCRSLTLEGLADQFKLNKYQLSRLFKQHTGMSLLQYIIGCRMDTAKQLLISTDISVATIASKVGYKSTTQFQAAFKKMVRTTPRHYRLEFNSKN